MFASTKYRKVARVDGKAESLLRRPIQTPKEIVGHIDDRAAALANQVAVRMLGQVVGGGAVSEMGVHDHAELLQFIEIAVDGRDVHIWRLGLHSPCQILCRHMPRCLEEDLEEKPTRACGPAPLLPHQGKHGVDGTHVG